MWVNPHPPTYVSSGADYPHPHILLYILTLGLCLHKHCSYEKYHITVRLGE